MTLAEQPRAGVSGLGSKPWKTTGSVDAVGTTVSDRVLLRRCRDGDAQSWEILVERYERLVFSIAMRNGLSREDACDVTQLTFMALLESVATLRDDERVAAWLMTVARRQAWKMRERNYRERAVADTTEPAQDETSSWERAAVVHEALQRIARPCRDLLMYLYFDPTEPSYAEIAQRMGCSVGTLGAMRARCLQRLRIGLRDAELGL